LAALEPQDQAWSTPSRRQTRFQSRPDAARPGQAPIQRQVQDLLRREEGEHAGQELRLPQFRGHPYPRGHGQSHRCGL